MIVISLYCQRHAKGEYDMKQQHQVLWKQFLVKSLGAGFLGVFLLPVLWIIFTVVPQSATVVLALIL